MQFITKDIKFLIKNINKILRENNSGFKVYIKEYSEDREFYINHTIEYFSINIDNYKYIIYSVTLRIKKEAPKQILEDLHEMVSSEIYTNILIRTEFEFEPLRAEEYWNLN